MTRQSILISFAFSFCAGQLLAGSGAELNQVDAGPEARSSVSLASLVDEAQRHNPEILAARRAWQAAAQAPSQVATLPDPEVTLQEFSVGNPIPFAGYTTSNFAYIGFGISQELPYPGKLRLRGEMAQREADQQRDKFDSTKLRVVEQLKTAYFRLASLQKTIVILERDGKLLEQVEKVSEARYGTGHGNQQDVLKAQLERTKLMREIVMHHQSVGSVQAQLKRILNRTPDAPDVIADELTLTGLSYTSDELLARVRGQNPEITAKLDAVNHQSLQVELAHKEFLPDFKVQYMWQRTGPGFPDYYMLTAGARIPIHRLRKQKPEVFQAVEQLNSSRHEYEAQVQHTYFEVKDRMLALETSAQLLKIYSDGLIPQATAVFQSGLSAYESNREDFETLLSSFLDVLKLDEEYWKTLADHQTALAQLERLTGLELVR
jgi:cobalt-zinc-cadmium efflux system outer membrane protein